MREFHDKKQRQRYFFSPITLGLLIIAIFFIGRSIWGIAGKNAIARDARLSAEARLAELEQKKGRLSADIERLGTPKGIEEEIRDKFPVVREGEELVVIVPRKETNESNVDEEEKRGFFDFLRHIF